MGLEAVYKILKFDEYLVEVNFLGRIFGQRKEKVINGKIPIVLFGAGELGKAFLPMFKCLGIDPICFCDSNACIDSYEGLPVISVDELKANYSDSLIIIMSAQHANSIKNILIETKICEENILEIESKLLNFYFDKGSILQLMLESDRTKEERELLPNLFGKLEQQVVKGDFPVVLFGAGAAGQDLLPLLNQHGVAPVCFCDNRLQSEHGFNVRGLPVVSLNTLNHEYKNSLVLICVAAHAKEIQKQLLDSGFSHEMIIVIESGLFLFYANLGRSLLSARIIEYKR